MFVLAHAPVAYTEESLSIAAFRPNVYVDLSGFQLHLAKPIEPAELMAAVAALARRVT